MVNFPFLRGRKSDWLKRPEQQHDLDRDQFKAVLETLDASLIEDRLNVLDVFLSTEKHVTLSDLEKMMADRGEPGLGNRMFLKETMEMFCQCGFAQKQQFAEQDTTYEHHHLGDHHDHFICTDCGNIQEFENSKLERLQLEIAKDFSFHPLQHKMEIYGICSNCMEKRAPNPPLMMAAPGERVEIVDIRGGKTMQNRLRTMGLKIGTCLEVINVNPAGPSIVAVEDTRLALGVGMTKNILIKHSCRHSDVNKKNDKCPECDD